MGRRRVRFPIVIFFVLAILLSGMPAAADSSGSYKIEQVYINKPDVTVYFRDPATDDTIEAYLGGEQLAWKDRALFADTGEAVEYYILLDISASIPASRFEDIKSSLSTFVYSMREIDKLVLITFGDEVIPRLEGTESREEADQVISQLSNRDQNTVLFEAIDYVSDRIWTAGNTSEMRRVVAVISDGKDCADNTRNTKSVENNLVSRGIPLYTLAVENNEGDSETEIANYRGSFSAMSRNTGGIPWAVSGNSVLDGLNQMQDSVMGTQTAKLQAKTNEISNRKEDLVLKFTGAGNMSDTVSVLVGRAQSDTSAPEVLKAESREENSISITFSEDVLGADTDKAYSVRKDGKAIPVQQVLESDEEENTYTLLFANDLYEGDYEIQFHKITDRSNEKNLLSVQSITLHTNWEKPDEPSPPETDTPTPPPDDPEEEPTFLDTLLKWWPAVLTALLLLFILIGLIIIRHVRKKRSVILVDGKEISADEIESKGHIEIMQQTLPEKSKNITLWISNGTDDPKEMDVIINGSCIIGRSQEKCSVYCDDPTMGRQHFVLNVEENQLFVTDLNSKNGTSVNGVRIFDHHRLNKRDEIRAGSLRFVVDWKDE